jgi:heme-degrading monooxygenase HmoA
MVAAVSIVRGAAEGMAEAGRLAADAVRSWLRVYEGFRGLVVMTDEEGEKARIITFWDTPEAEERARAGRASMRDRLVGTVGMEVVGMELYEVPVLDLLAEPA